MDDAIEIPLHRDTPPSFADVVGWVIGANVFVVTTVTLVFVVLPWLSGHQPRLDAQTLVLSGATAVVLLVGFLFVAFRRHRRQRVAAPAGHLRLDASSAELRAPGGPPARCSRDEFVARPVHAHENLRGTDYYMGPALQLTMGDVTCVVAHLDGRRRWAYDPPAVTAIDWICTAEAWRALVAAQALTDELVAYEG